MRDVAARAVLLSLSRIANQGLLMLSPIILVRVLSVEDFGRYREFMVYASIMQGVAGLLINSSLMSFVPAHPEHTWQFVRQSVTLVAITSVASVALLWIADALAGGGLVGGYLLPVVLYTLFFVNFDFWQPLWLAQKQATLVMLYASGRLALRLTVVLVAAALSRNVTTIIWSIIAFEFCRMCAGALSWLRKNRAAAEPRGSFWREQLRFSVPLGMATIVGTLNTRAAPLAMAKYRGPAALAEYTLGTYVESVVAILRNSLSEALLPDLVSRRASARDSLTLWRRTTIVYLILMVPVALVTAGCAEPIVVTLFTEKYRGAIPVMQVYSLILLRECFDFGILLRATNETVPFLQNHAMSLVLNILLLVLLVPAFGAVGAVTALVVARYCEAFFLGWRACRAYGISPRHLLDWREVGKVLAAAMLAGVALLVASQFGGLSLALTVAVALGFCALFAALLWTFRVGEAFLLWSGLKRLTLRGRG
jgi:O-antigen/teichoic acid export membrane protein